MSVPAFAMPLLPLCSLSHLVECVRMLSGPVYAERWRPCPGFLSVRGLNRAC